eukprot:3579755-Amphidinium_carterae.1
MSIICDTMVAPSAAVNTGMAGSFIQSPLPEPLCPLKALHYSRWAGIPATAASIAQSRHGCQEHR